MKPVLSDNWLTIYFGEKRRGEEVGKSREKMTSTEEMLQYAFKHESIFCTRITKFNFSTRNLHPSCEGKDIVIK